MEITDFAAALRAMADNVVVLAERHDVKDMAQLRRDADEHVVKTRRDADLIDELRRQVEVMGRSLDAIGRMRRHVLTMKAPDAIQIFADALLILAGERCSNYTGSAKCRDMPSRTRTAEYTAGSWCGECVARDALERAGALPAVSPGEQP